MAEKKYAPLVGVGVFGLAMAVLIYICGPLQMRYGIAGVAMTEVILLGVGLIATVLTRSPLKEVFPFHVPKLRHIGGAILIWLGGLVTGLIVSIFIGIFFPKGLQEVTSGIGDVISGPSFLVSLLVVAVMPAICEEGLCRGFIFHMFSGIKNKWIIVVSMGVIFGIFHTSFYRFFPTAILGGMISLVLYETKNFWMPMMMHFLNNAFSVCLNALVNMVSSNLPVDTEMVNELSAEVTSASFVSALGVYLILGCFAPLAFVGGYRLIREKTAPRKTSSLIIAGVLAGVMLILGFVLLMAGAFVTINNMQ